MSACLPVCNMLLQLMVFKCFQVLYGCCLSVVFSLVVEVVVIETKGDGIMYLCRSYSRKVFLNLVRTCTTFGQE